MRPTYIFNGILKYSEYGYLFREDKNVQDFLKQHNLDFEYMMKDIPLTSKIPSGMNARDGLQEHYVKLLKELNGRLYKTLKDMPSKIH